MPMSNPAHVPVVLHYLIALAPRSILDIGVGTGTYGFLARQFLDIAQQQLSKKDWTTQIDGIEIFERYQNPIWSHFYDGVLIADIRAKLDSLPVYDVILCNDVLEHFERETARNLIARLLHCCNVLIATTPNREFPQGSWAGNDAETHRSLLSLEDFPLGTLTHETGITSCFVCSRSKETAEQLAHIAAAAPRVLIPRMSICRRIQRRIQAAIGRHGP